MPEFASIDVSGAGKFNALGVTGVSCALGNSGFSKNGNSGSVKDVVHI